MRAEKQKLQEKGGNGGKPECKKAGRRGLSAGIWKCEAAYTVIIGMGVLGSS